MDVLQFSTTDRELVFNFFAFFSRFEFALKNGGFLTGNADKAEAHWDKFADSLNGAYLNISDLKFKKSVNYLTTKPPQKQFVLDGTLRWKESKRGEGESLEKFVLRLVRCVRNNYFMGENIPTLMAREESARNRKLMKRHYLC